jgi:hypothetical protein
MYLSPEYSCRVCNIYKENHITETINIDLSQSLYYISDIGNNIFTNLIHVTTKATRIIMATVLEQALTIVRLTSTNLQKKILKNPVFKSTFIFLDVY